jgi:competence protein ComEC
MRPMVYMAVSLAVGIAAAEWLRPHPALALAALLLCALWAAASRRHGATALLATLAMLGALHYSYVQTAGRGDLGAWQGRKVALIGTVITEPELRKPSGLAYVLKVERVEGHPATGKLYVTQRSPKAPAYGERVELRGTLKPPSGARTPGGFDQAAYLARQAVYLTVDTGEVGLKGPGDLFWLRRAAVATRIRLEGVLKATLPPREAALSAGLLFGSRSDLPDDIKEAFKTSGVIHLLAVSGGNVAMVIMPLLGLLRRAGLSKRAASLASVPAVVFFVFLTGAGPSVMRAGLMAVLVLLGAALRREKDAVNTLGAAALLLLLVSPGLLFDLGFQLSAGATLGILLFARSIEEWLTPRFQLYLGEKPGGWLASGLSVTFAAQVLVEPISLHNFGAFSTIAPVANLLVLAFIDPVVKLGTVATLAGALWLPLGWALNQPVRLGLNALVFLIKATAEVPLAYLQVGHLPTVWMVAWYAGLVAVTSPGARGQLRALLTDRRTLTTAAACLALLAATGFTWSYALADPPDTLRVTFLDVGQGDSILIEAPGGGTMLVDAGMAYPTDAKTGRPGFDAGEQVVLPFLARRGIDRLEYLVLTHPDQDHAGGGAAVLEGVTVGQVLKSDQGATESGYVNALQAAARNGIPARQPVAGERIDLGGGVIAEVIGPPREPYQGSRSDDNANCVAFRLIYRQVTLLLTCDFEAVSEEALLARKAPLRADLLKVAHHGSRHSSTAPFLQAVQPRYAIVSAGNGNSFGHPNGETLDRLAAVGATVYRTDRHGTITARTDGLTLSVSGARGGPEDDQYRPLGLLRRRWLRAW